MLASGSSNMPAATALLSHVHGSGADIGVRRHALFFRPVGTGEIAANGLPPPCEEKCALCVSGVYIERFGSVARRDELYDSDPQALVGNGA